MDELRRVEELNKALVGADIPAMDNLKYAKNRSHQAQSLVEGQPRSQYATAMAEYDRSCFLNKNLGKRKPIFKNYIQNNTSILRKEIQTKKKQHLQALQDREEEYLDRLTSKVNSFTGSNKSRTLSFASDPVSTVQKLMKTTNREAFRRATKAEI
jgi:t-SNARE complex subunit (syntaxin)